MSFPYKNPQGGLRVGTPWKVDLDSVVGSNYSVYNIGGYMEVYTIDDLNFITSGTSSGLVNYSGNTIPISFNKRPVPTLSDYVTLWSDGISSGRRRLGMLVYVHETQKTYQYTIPNYDDLWTAATASGAIEEGDQSTPEYTVYNRVPNSPAGSPDAAGQALIEAWTGSTVEGVNGVSRDDARWRIFWGTDWQVTGGTVTYNNTGDLNLYSNYFTGSPVTISGLTTITGGTYLSGSSTLRLVNNLGDNIDITGIAADTNTFVTGGTYSSGTTTLTLTRNDGFNIDVTGFTASGFISVSANTGLGIENDVLYTTYNTLLDPSLSMAETIGGLDAGTTVADLSGDTFVSLFNDLLFPTVNPTYTIPTISIGGVSSSTREVGTTLSLSITASATKNDAGDFTQLRVLRDGSALVTDTTMTISSASDVPDQFGYSNPNNPNSGFTLNSSPYSESYTVPSPVGSSTSTSTQYRVDGNYNAGQAKNDNKGNVDTRSPAVRSSNAPQSASNNYLSTQYTYTGIYPYFWGVSTTQPSASDIVNQITGGTANKVLSSASSTITITFGASSQYLWFAHFSNYTNKTVWYVDALNSGSIGGGTNLFGTPTTNSVDSPDGYWSGINFEIYISNYQTSTSGSMQLRNS
jgi:hypothetical protein